LLKANDPDNDPQDLTFSIRDLTGGKLVRVVGEKETDVEGTPELTAEDLTSGEYAIRATGETAPAFKVSAKDPSGLESDPIDAVVTFTEVNDKPVMEPVSVAITEDGLASLTSEMLRATDPDNESKDLTFSVKELTGGKLVEFVDGRELDVKDARDITAADLGAGKYAIRAMGETAPAFKVAAKDPSGLESDPVDATIAFTEVNDKPVMEPISLAIAEDGLASLTRKMLRASDDDNESSELTFSVKEITGAKLVEMVEGRETDVEGSPDITDADLTAGRYAIRATGEDAPTLKVAAKDPAGLESDSVDATVAFAATNDKPVMEAVSVTIAEDGLAALTPEMLRATDADGDPKDLTFSVRDLKGAKLVRVVGEKETDVEGTPELTAADLSSREFAIRAVGEETPSFKVRAKDADGLEGDPIEADVTFVAINDKPVMEPVSVALAEDGLATLNGEVLRATDPDNESKDLTFSIKELTGAKLVEMVDGKESDVKGSPDITAADLTAGKYAIRATGEDAPTLKVAAKDIDGLESDPVDANVTFVASNDKPVMETVTVAIAEDGLATINSKMLRATDADNESSELTFSVKELTGARLVEMVDGKESAVKGSPDITAADLTAGKYAIRATGEAAPAFKVAAKDATGLESDPVDADVTFAAVNDKPVMETVSVDIVEDGLVTLNAELLRASDPDNETSELTFSVRELTGAKLVQVVSEKESDVDGSPDITAADLSAGRYAIRATGEVAPTFKVAAKDAAGLESDPVDAAVTFTPVNDAPVVEKNAVTVQRGGTALLSEENLLATDADPVSRSKTGESTTTLTYTASELTAARFVKTVDGVDNEVTSFTQAEIKAGKVKFESTDDTIDADYSLSVSDGVASSALSRGVVTMTAASESKSVETRSEITTEVDETTETEVATKEVAAKETAAKEVATREVATEETATKEAATVEESAARKAAAIDTEVATKEAATIETAVVKEPIAKELVLSEDSLANALDTASLETGSVKIATPVAKETNLVKSDLIAEQGAIEVKTDAGTTIELEQEAAPVETRVVATEVATKPETAVVAESPLPTIEEDSAVAATDVI